jgi:hypothetical protein
VLLDAPKKHKNSNFGLQLLKISPKYWKISTFLALEQKLYSRLHSSSNFLRLKFSHTKTLQPSSFWSFDRKLEEVLLLFSEKIFSSMKIKGLVKEAFYRCRSSLKVYFQFHAFSVNWRGYSTCSTSFSQVIGQFLGPFL